MIHKVDEETKSRVIQFIMRDIKKDLKNLGINHNNYISEQMIASKDKVEKLKKLIN